MCSLSSPTAAGCITSLPESFVRLDAAVTPQCGDSNEITSWEQCKVAANELGLRLAIFIRRERMAAAPPSSDLLVAVFIVVTACLPTWHRFASADAVFVLFLH